MVAEGVETGPDEAAILVANERRKLTAIYLNTAAGCVLTAGVPAPIAAAVFGLAGAGVPIGALTLVFGA